MTDSLPVISTLVLNWNRGYLLKQTLESYVQTVTLPYELWIIDNGSSDDSAEVIAAFAARYPQAKVMMLGENRGGEAYNAAIEKARGAFIQLSENDQIYLPGWCEKMQAAFTANPRLGQLSLHAPVPTDEEAWVSKPVSPRFRRGCLLYYVHGNVTTSSILRRELFEQGLRIANLERKGGVRFPDDGKLSQDVKQLGYWVGYSDHYYVRNIGHEAEEIRANPNYYMQNYDAKPSVGAQALEQRIGMQRQLQAVQRHSRVLPEEKISPEVSMQRVGMRDARFWSMVDGWTPEVENVEFITSLVRMVKPQAVLETGGWLGHITTGIAQALTDNGMGTLTVLEKDAHAYPYLSQKIAQAAWPHVTLKREESDRFRAEQLYDMAVFDSAIANREEEFFFVVQYLSDQAMVVFCNMREDAAALDNLPRKLERMGVLSGQYFATPRGLYVGKITKRVPAPKERIVFCLSAGRSGTSFLTHLLKGIDDMVALHEPEPKYQWQTPALQQDGHQAAQFLQEYKFPWITALPGKTYFEASHYIAKGFLDAWLDSGVAPDAIILGRDVRRVATSWYALGADFHQRPAFVLQHMLHPEDKRPLFLPFPRWRECDDYQLCYWYALEIEARKRHYSALLTQRGGRIFDASLERLISGEDIEPLFAWLGIALTEEMRKTIRIRLRKKINDQSTFKDEQRVMALKQMDMDTLERDMRARL